VPNEKDRPTAEIVYQNWRIKPCQDHCFAKDTEDSKISQLLISLMLNIMEITGKEKETCSSKEKTSDYHSSQMEREASQEFVVVYSRG